MRSLWSWQRWMIGWSNTSNTARRSALAPSITQRIGRVTPGRARAGRPAARGPGWRSRWSLHQRQGMLGPVQVDPKGDHAGVLAEVDPVDQQADQVQPGQVAGEQLG